MSPSQLGSCDVRFMYICNWLNSIQPPFLFTMISFSVLLNVYFLISFFVVNCFILIVYLLHLFHFFLSPPISFSVLSVKRTPAFTVQSSLHLVSNFSNSFVILFDFLASLFVYSILTSRLKSECSTRSSRYSKRSFYLNV